MVVGGLTRPRFRAEPGPGVGPEAVGLARGDAEQLGRLRNRQAGEVAQLDESAAPGVVVRQLGQGLVQGEQVVAGLPARRGPTRRGPCVPVRPRAWHGAAPGALDEDAAHGLGGGGEEVSAAVPMLRFLHVHQPQVRLVDQRGGLERLAGLFLGQLLAGELPQFVVDQRQELRRRRAGRLARSLLKPV